MAGYMQGILYKRYPMLDYELNQRIKKLAPKYTVRDISPDTFHKLVSNEGIVVWAGASDKTVYGDPSVNWAMRAWHDNVHKQLNADFTLEGETRVAIEQCRIIGGQMAEIVMAEVVGQATFYKEKGYFPLDQMEFVKNYLKGLK